MRSDKTDESEKVVPRSLIGAAGVYHVASELSRRGLIALPTTRNTKGYDIIVADPEGSCYANIDVKTSQRCVIWWPMPSSDSVCAGPNDYYVLLRWIKKEKRFEGFMLTGVEAKKEVVRSENEDPSNVRNRSEGKHIWTGVDVGRVLSEDAVGWKRRWEIWTLNPHEKPVSTL